MRGTGRAKAIIRQGIKRVSAGVDLLRRPPTGVTVLIYHRVGGIGGSVDLDPARFADQMAELSASQRLRRLDDALDDLDDLDDLDTDSPIPRRVRNGTVVVTFDDGTADFVDHALPILVEHRIPTLLYAATRFIDEGLDFPGGGPAISWAGLAEAVSTGLVDIGAHTHSHVLLDRLPTDRIADELDRCNGLIEDNLQQPARHFAYPKAVLGSPAAETEVRARYRSAAIAGTRPNPIGRTDPYRLARSPIQVADGMRWFRHKVDGGMGFEDDLRRLINRRRYATATT